MRVLSLLCAMVCLASCGFTPLYSTSTTHDFSAVSIASIPDESGVYLRNALTDRLHAKGEAQKSRFTLTLSPVEEGITDLAITKSADATRAQMRLSTTMKLEDEKGNSVLTRKLRAITSYNILASEFTNRVSQDAARKSALNDLARQAEQHLALYLTP